jgi:AP2-like factor (ANT lineage)
VPTIPTSTPLSPCDPNLKPLPHPQRSLRSKRSLNSNILQEDAKFQSLAKKPAVAPAATAATRPFLPSTVPTDDKGNRIISDAVATIVNIIPAGTNKTTTAISPNNNNATTQGIQEANHQSLQLGPLSLPFTAAAAAATPEPMQSLLLDQTTYDKVNGGGVISPIIKTTTTRSGRIATLILTSNTKKDRRSSRPIISSDPPISSPITDNNIDATKSYAEKTNNNNNSGTLKISQNTNLEHPTKSIKATPAYQSGGTFNRKYRGVTKHRVTGRYEAHFWDSSYVRPTATAKTVAPPKKGKKAKGGGRARGKQVYLGAYANGESAAKAYDRAALAYLGPIIAPTNFPVENYKVHLERIMGKDPQDVVTELRVGSMGFSRGKSLFKGVVQHHTRDDGDQVDHTWEARLGLGKEVLEQGPLSYICLGRFNTVEDAAIAYDRANVKYRGSKAVTNFGLSNYLDILEDPDSYLFAIVPSYTTLSNIPDDKDEEYICDAAGVQLDKEALQMRKKHNVSGVGGRKSVRKSRAKTTTINNDDDDDASAGTATDSKQQYQQQQGEAPWIIGGHALPEHFIAELLDFNPHLPTIQVPFKHLPPPTTTTINSNNNNEHIAIPVKYDAQGNLVLVHDPGNPLVLPGIGMITELGSLNSVVQQQQQQPQQQAKSIEGPALWDSNVFGSHRQTAGSLPSFHGLDIGTTATTTTVPATLRPLPQFGIGPSHHQDQALGTVFNDSLSIANILKINNNNSTGPPPPPPLPLLVRPTPIRITNPPPPPPFRPIPTIVTNPAHDISKTTPIEKARVNLQSAIMQQQQ